MKTYFLITAIGIGLLSAIPSFAGEPLKLRPEDDVGAKGAAGVRLAEPSHNRAVKLASPHFSLNASVHVPAKSISPPGQSSRSSANEIRLPASKKAPAAASRGTTVNKMASHYEPPRKLPVSGATSPSLPGAAHSHSNVPAHVGGLMASSAKNSTASLNGASMKRKAW